MRRVVKVLVWAWIIQNSVCSVSLPEITDREFIDQCVKEHNAARSSVSPAASNMLYMTWDAGLASTAKAWSKNCLFQHSPSPLGENIWTGYPPSSFDVKDIIEGWVKEVEHYDYSSNKCYATCGHYTQVVWASTHKVGCAAQLCPKESVIFVCNYEPSGNNAGQKPYKSQGAPCSGCEPGYTCIKKLCNNQKQDLPTNYESRYLDSPISTRDYLVILIIRPLALVCTGLAAYGVHHYYPNIFYYE